MIRTKIVETIEKYDKDGNLIEKTIREESTEDDETRCYPLYPTTTTFPYKPFSHPDCPYTSSTNEGCSCSNTHTDN